MPQTKREQNEQRANDLAVMGAYLRDRRFTIELALNARPTDADRATLVEELRQIERLGRLHSELFGETCAVFSSDNA